MRSSVGTRGRLASSPRASRTFPAIGVLAQVSVTRADALDEAAELVAAELRALDLACSRFRDDSELARLNRSAGRPFAAGALLLDVLAVALGAAAATGGDVDPTVGRAMRGLGWDRDFALVRVGREPRSIRIVPAAGWRSVELDRRRGLVSLPAGVELDLGSIAKAYAADRCAQLVQDATGAGVLVSLGGDMAAAGTSPGGGWSLRIADDHRASHSPLPVPAKPAPPLRGASVEPTAPGPVVAIRDGGLATSSTAVRRWRAAGAERHHPALTYPPVWYLMRATGIVSLLLLTLVVALGVATSQRARLPGQPRGATVGLHRSASLLAVVFLAVHVLTAVLDPDAAVGLVSLLVPFAGSARPLWVALGALATQLVAALVVTSLLRHRMTRRTWRGIHWLAYAAWPLALVHGIGMGSDTATSWMLLVNLACVGSVGAALMWRLGANEPRQRQALSVGQSLVTSPRRVSRS